jgi:hypothetical protein
MIAEKFHKESRTRLNFFTDVGRLSLKKFAVSETYLT